MRKTLKGKILLGVILALLLLVSMVDFSLIRILNNNLQDKIKNYMNTLSYVYISEFRNEVILNGEDENYYSSVFLNNNIIENEERGTYVVFLYEDKRKEVGFISGILNKDDLIEAKRQDDKHKTNFKMNYKDKNNLIITYTYPTYIEGKYHGTLFIQADYSKDYKEIVKIIKRIVVIEVTVISVLLIFIYFLLTKLIRPIESLCNFMNRIGEGEYVEDINVDSSTEVKSLYESFNNMKNQISNQIEVINCEKYKVEKLQKSTKDFFDNVTHEMKTPIAAISGYSQLLIEDELDMETRQRALNRIGIENNRLNSLVTNILEISKGKSLVVKDKEMFDLASIIKDVIDEMGVRFKKNGIIVDKTLITMNCFLVKEEFKQVVVNLIDNAIKYTCDNKIEIITYENGTNGILEVKNKCNGIDNALNKEIFKPFVKYTYNKNGVNSSGLGLYICKELIEKNNGSIECEIIDEIICFRVILPRV